MLQTSTHPGTNDPLVDMGGITRRGFLARSVAAAAVVGAGGIAGQGIARSQATGPEPAQKAAGGTRLIMLGTAGGLVAVKGRCQAAQVLLVNGSAYVIDCGNGVTRQLLAADVPLTSLRHIFITHHHDDHNADYGSLLLVAWASGLATPVDTWGPPPLVGMTDLFRQLNDYDITVRMASAGLPDIATLIEPHEFNAGGVILEDENVKVTATLVNHPPVVPAFGYRFDTADRSVVISGDTTKSENLIALAQGADVLIHASLYLPDSLADAQRAKSLAIHTPVDQVGEVAAAAGVKKLVLSHLLPASDPSISDQTWIDGAKVHFSGEVIVGRDLLEV